MSRSQESNVPRHTHSVRLVSAGYTIDWNAVLETYGGLFGDVLCMCRLTEADAERDPRFILLIFGPSSRHNAPIVYATWGAPGGELALLASRPCVAFEQLIAEAAAEGGALAPLTVAPYAGLDTPFRGFIVTPLGDRPSPATRRVQQIVPLTPAELERARSCPLETVDNLRAAGATVADPLRACMFDPEHTEWFRKEMLHATIRWLRRRCAAHHAKVADMRAAGAPSEEIEPLAAYGAMLDVELAVLEERGPVVATDEELLAQLDACSREQRGAAAIDALVQYGYDVLHPFATELSHQVFPEFLTLVVTSHPAIVGPLHTIATQQRPPRDWRDPETFAYQVYMRLLALAEREGGEHRKSMIMGVFRGLVEAKRTLPENGEVSWARHLWVHIVTAMYTNRCDTSTLEGRAVARAVRMAIMECSALTITSDEQPLFLRLLAAVEEIAMSLLIGLCMVDSPEMGEDAN